MERCSFSQWCTKADDPKTCDLPYKVDIEPFDYNTTVLDICPDFIGKKACCNAGQNYLMQENFRTIDQLFSSAFEGGGGCDICAINLKRLWCQFTCHPNQADFVKPGKLVNVTDGAVIKTVLQLNMTLNLKMNCDLFNSCKKTKYANLVTSMANAIGFTTFQGAESYRKGPTLIDMFYDDKDGLIYDIDPCNMNVEVNKTTGEAKVRGYPVKKNCTCNSCESFCVYDKSVGKISVWEGFNGILVGILFLSTVFVTVLMFLLKKYRKKDEVNRQSMISINEPEEETKEEYSKLRDSNVESNYALKFNSTANNINK